MEKLKIAIVEPVGGHGGLDFYNLGLTESIASKGNEVYLYTSDTTALDSEIKNIKTNVRKYYKNIYNKDNKYIRGIRYLTGTFKSLIHSKNNSVQVAHFQIYNFSKLELFNMSLFKLCGIKIIATIHDVEKLSGMDVVHSQNIYEKFQSLIDQVIVHTEFTKNTLVKYFIGYEDSITIVPHGDMDFIYKKELSKEEALAELKLDVLSNKKIILLFGQIKKVKGLDILLKAFAKIKDKHKDTIVMVVGKLWKNEEDEYIKIIKDSNMENQVKLELKFIDNKDVPLYFKIADIVALPYKKIYNSGVILRALDYGSTVLVSDLAPLTKIITHNENGYVFRSEDVDDMAQKIDKLLENDKLRDALKRNAMNYIKENFSWDLIAEKTIDVYKQALENK